MRRVVLDANVLAPGFLGATSASARLISLWSQQAYDLVVSEHLRGGACSHLHRSLLPPAHQPGADSQQVLALLRRRAVLTPLTVTVSGVATQPKDDLVLATGLSARASYTGQRDRQLMKLGRYQGLRILHPGDLVGVLQREAEERS